MEKIQELFTCMIDEFEINRRMKELRNHLKVTVDDFSLKTGIKSGQISSIENNRQKVYGWHIQVISDIWPKYAYWLATGKTIEDCGQISPELEETRRNLKTGT
ncbi:helix-turn-helix transcriptional regulator [Methylomicrobium sp. Wu6]|uniref:helix-turn-helix transcriptional regulator n=1 Tax=Methylomicrobium sp. Wu6 TaxID=3107928 RepID=UPI002DD694E5|nr:helix-turn-helix transcriptional regulator [Methylomicrobium sp. Wu6]MEC4749814.1 helix-turn-helix transcriptional regulator [Methylomicrobium sp. Wu6]